LAHIRIGEPEVHFAGMCAEVLSGVPPRQPEGTAMSRETLPRRLVHRLLGPDAVGASPR
jgi:hypothetical protein